MPQLYGNSAYGPTLRRHEQPTADDGGGAGSGQLFAGVLDGDMDRSDADLAVAVDGSTTVYGSAGELALATDTAAVDKGEPVTKTGADTAAGTGRSTTIYGAAGEIAVATDAGSVQAGGVDVPISGADIAAGLESAALTATVTGAQSAVRHRSSRPSSATLTAADSAIGSDTATAGVSVAAAQGATASDTSSVAASLTGSADRRRRRGRRTDGHPDRRGHRRSPRRRDPGGRVCVQVRL